MEASWEFPKFGVPCFGVLIIRILLFRALNWDPLFSETPRYVRVMPRISTVSAFEGCFIFIGVLVYVTASYQHEIRQCRRAGATSNFRSVRRHEPSTLNP